MGHGVRRFHELRAWQACDVYKKAVYQLCLDNPLANDWKRRGQLEDAVAGRPGHVAEGFGKFNSHPKRCETRAVRASGVSRRDRSGWRSAPRERRKARGAEQRTKNKEPRTRN
jgi:hypothetical protein